MLYKQIIILVTCCFFTACAGARQVGDRSTTDVPNEESWQNERFQQLEADARPLDVETAMSLPEVAEEEDHFFVVEAMTPAPEVAEDNTLAPLLPPADWSIGTTAESQEVRLQFLEPEGGSAMVDVGENPPQSEVDVTWLVRYERRNMLLTEEGANISVHVVPVAVRVDTDNAPIYWISSEAPN